MNRAERLVERIKAMPIEDIRAHIEGTRPLTNDEVEMRQIERRRAWAEEAARRFRGE